MIRPFTHATTAFASVLAALFFSGCEKPQIRVYTVPKDAPPATPAPATAAGERPERARPKPQVTFTKPEGWQEAGANALNLVNFLIKTDAGQATVNITPLTGMQGNEAAIVNMWRAQVDQPALNDQDIAKEFTPVDVAGETGQLFEITSADPNKSLRIVTAFAHRGDQTWFYKLQGNADVVAAQKPAFIEFLKSVKISDAPATAATGAASATPSNPTASAAPTTPPTTEPAPAPAMVAPESWKALPPGQMQFAKFSVSAADGAKAEVSVSVFPSDTGGTLANVNRWRRQLGMGDVDEAGLQEIVTPLDGPSIAGAPGSVLADLTHENRRMLGAIVPRDGRWWFYKMMGDAAAVNAERENFVQFVKNQP